VNYIDFFIIVTCSFFLAIAMHIALWSENIFFFLLAIIVDLFLMLATSHLLSYGFGSL